MVESLWSFTLFLSFLLICIYLPAKFLLQRLKITLSSLEDIFLSLGLGLVIFTLVAYVFSWIKLEFAILPFFLIIDVFAIRTKQWLPKKIEKKHIIPLVSILLLSLLFSLSMVLMGKFGDTINYRRDDLWHLALINELKVHYPPDNPGFAQVPLKGYHFFYNFFVAKVSNIFFLSPFSLHFHLMPLFFAFLWGIGVYTFLFSWSKRISVAVWGVFLTQFGGSFAYLLYLQGHPMVSLNNGFGISQANGALNNPPFAFSIIILLTAFLTLYHYTTTRKKRWLVPLVLCIGIITMFKVYAGIILMGGFLVLTCIELLKKRFIILLALLGVIGIFLGTYWIFGSGAGYLIYYPLWPAQKVLQSFPWYGYDEKIYTYTQQHVITGIIKTELYGLTLFIFGNQGTRLLGILLLPLFLKGKQKRPSSFIVIFIAMIFISLLLPLFFIQSGKVFEIIQMGWYYLFLCALLAAFGFGYLWDLKYAKPVKIGMLLFIVLLTLPSASSDVIQYGQLSNSAQSLSGPKFKAYAYLSHQDNYDATVLEVPPEYVQANETSLNIWYVASSPEIVAFANKRAYFVSEFIDFPGINLSKRMELIKDIILFNKTDKIVSSKIKKALASNNIRYLYSTYPLKGVEGVKIVYSNKDNYIYKVQ